MDEVQDVSLILLLTASPRISHIWKFPNLGRKKPRNERLEATFFSIRYGLASEMSDVATQPMRLFSLEAVAVLFHAYYIVHDEIVKVLVCLFWCVLLNNFWVALPNTLVICLTQLTHLNLFDVGQSVI